MGLEYSTTTTGKSSSLLFVAKGEHSVIEPDATHYRRVAQKVQLKLQEENHHQRGERGNDDDIDKHLVRSRRFGTVRKDPTHLTLT